MSDRGSSSKRSSRRNSEINTDTESDSSDSHSRYKYDTNHHRREGFSKSGTKPNSHDSDHSRSLSTESIKKYSPPPPPPPLSHDDASITASPSSKRPKRSSSVKCPICYEFVTPNQYQQHYRMELSNLEAGASAELTRGKRGAAITATKQFNKGKARRSTADDEKRGTLNDIQKRRTARQNNKDIIRGSLTGRSSGLDLGLVRGSSIRSSTNIDGNDDDSPATCFICNERLFGSLDDINNHIDSCLTNPQPTAHNNHQQHHSHTQSGYGSSGLNTPISNNGGGGGGGGGSATSSATATPTTASSNGRMGDSFEEYTWAGQTRVRVTSLFEGGMASLGSGGGGGGGGGSRSGQTDIDDDLNVDDDEEEEYGGVQFTERDIVMDDATDPDADELREIVIASSSVGVRAASPPARRRTPIIPLNEQPQQQQQQSRIKKRGNNAKKRKTRPDRDVDILDEGDDPGDYDDDEIDEDAEIDLEGEGEPDDEDEDEEVENDEDDEDDEEDENVDALIGNAFASGDTRLVIDALRAKIKHLESANRNVPSCLICLEPYTVPLTSIVCWHVHCEACWMKTLGSKKLCPQCQKITLPKDLRRIYI